MMRWTWKYLILLSSLALLAACSSSSETTGVRRNSDRNGGVSRPALPDDISAGRRAVVTESYNWLSTPYRYAGTSKRGVDCSGLVNAVFQKFRLSLPRRARELYQKGRAVSRGNLLPADLVFFANTAGVGITHVGIYLGEDRFIHSSTRAGVIISSLDDSYYSSHYAGARMLIK
ncbi:MAG: C40 family peptidase [Bacteroidota bacterium]|jgi:cell wall-associated NlpC family hydrolase